MKGDFVLTATTPLFVVPGDEFTASVTVANQLEGAAVTDQVDRPGRGRRRRGDHRGRAGDANHPGGQGGHAALPLPRHRPTGQCRTEIHRRRAGRAGRCRAAPSACAPAWPARRRSRAAGSATARMMWRSTIPCSGSLPNGRRSSPPPRSAWPTACRPYLKEYPHGCTEQITSRAWPWLVLKDDANFGIDPGGGRQGDRRHDEPTRAPPGPQWGIRILVHQCAGRLRLPHGLRRTFPDGMQKQRLPRAGPALPVHDAAPALHGGCQGDATRPLTTGGPTTGEPAGRRRCARRRSTS